MKKLKTPFFALAVTVLVLYIANWIPKLVFNLGENENAFLYPKAEALNTLLEKGAFLGRALKNDVFWGTATDSKHGFETENFGYLEYEEKNAYFEKLISLIDEGKLPGFLSVEVQDTIESAVAERIELSSSSGKSLPLIHIYYEWFSDWSNWMEIYVDEETGKILYAYFSGSCQKDGMAYAADYPEIPSLEELSALYTDYMGYSIESLAYSENPNENAVIITCGDGSKTGRCKINLIYYAGTMYDIKISPQP